MKIKDYEKMMDKTFKPHCLALFKYKGQILKLKVGKVEPH